MPTQQDLTGKFIATTYQKLLQIDNSSNIESNSGSFDAANYSNFDIDNNIYNDENSLLDGNGKYQQGFVIDHTQNGNGGIYIKHKIKDSYMWGSQIEVLNGHSGLLWWQPWNGNKLFLKNTGTLWVGNPNIENDDSEVSLYVKKGIKIGLDNSADSHIKSTKSMTIESGISDSNYSSHIILGKTAENQPGPNYMESTSRAYVNPGVNIMQSGCYRDNGKVDLQNWIRVGDVVHVVGYKQMDLDNGKLRFPILVGNGANMEFIAGHGTYTDPNGEGIKACEIKRNAGSTDSVGFFSIMRPPTPPVNWLQPYELNYSAGGSVRFSYSYSLRPSIL